MSYQKTVICGHIGKAAEIRQTQNGAKAISFSVAVNRNYVDGDGVLNEQVTWFACTKWVQPDGSTEVAKYLQAGSLVTVDGEVSAHAYKNKEGKWNTSIDLRVDKLQLLSKPKDKEESK